MANMNIKPERSETMPEDGYDRSPVIYLNDDQCEALGIKAPPAPGAVLELYVKATVKSVTASQEEADEKATEGNSPDVYLTLCAGDIELIDSGKSIADSLYGE